MSFGEGARIAAGLFGMGLMVAALIFGMEWFERHWFEFAEGASDDQPPSYRGPCRCAACRLRPSQPCSGFDEG